jgi:hypothetical protein
VDGALTWIAPIRPLQLCADGGYQLRLGVLGVPLIMVPDIYKYIYIYIFVCIYIYNHVSSVVDLSLATDCK